MPQTTQHTNIPKLRFPGFEGSWIFYKIGDISSVTAGGTPSTLKKEYWNGDIRWMNSGELNLKKVFEVENRISTIGLNNSSTKIVPKLSILIGLAGQGKTRGTAAMNMVELCTNQSIAAIYPNPKLFISEFLYQNIDSRYDELRRLSTGEGGRGGLNLQIIKAIKVHFPSLPEQQKIALFLSAVDKKIQELTCKKELLEQYKKGAMQKIFSQEIRFRNENGKDYPDWERKRGKEVFVSHSNKNHNGDLPILAATQDRGMVYRDSIGIEIKSSNESVISYKIVEPGDFVISLRSFQGGIEYSEVKGICSPAYIILKPKTRIDKNFFKFYFKKEEFITRLSKTVVGIRDGKQISYDAFGGLKLQIPSVDEQKKIASYISKIDNKIEQTNLHIEKTQQFKKGLLQQMFV
ncbi:hypothetical protein ES705_34053 [subsurface metagenome]